MLDRKTALSFMGWFLKSLVSLVEQGKRASKQREISFSIWLWCIFCCVGGKGSREMPQTLVFVCLTGVGQQPQCVTHRFFFALPRKEILGWRAELRYQILLRLYQQRIWLFKILNKTSTIQSLSFFFLISGNCSAWWSSFHCSSKNRAQHSDREQFGPCLFPVVLCPYWINWVSWTLQLFLISHFVGWFIHAHGWLHHEAMTHWVCGATTDLTWWVELCCPLKYTPSPQWRGSNCKSSCVVKWSTAYTYKTHVS